jgi:hypothetical protein
VRPLREGCPAFVRSPSPTSSPCGGTAGGPEGRRGAPSPPAPLPRCGRGGSWLADSVLNPTESKFSRGDLTSGRGGSWLADSVLNPTESKFSRGDLTSGRGGSWLADSVLNPTESKFSRGDLTSGRGGSWLADSVLNPTESKFSRGDLTSGRGGSWLADSVLNPTESKFSRGDLTSGRGGSWLADSVSLTDAGAGSPLLCYPPSAAPCGRTAGGPEGRRGAPSPLAPLPRCGRGGSWLADSVLNPTESKFSRGDLTSGRGGSWLADSVSLTDAGAGSPLLCYPPSAAPCGGTAGGRRGGVGRLTPSPSPALRERGELVGGLSIKPHGVEVLEG